MIIHTSNYFENTNITLTGRNPFRACLSKNQNCPQLTHYFLLNQYQNITSKKTLAYDFYQQEWTGRTISEYVSKMASELDSDVSLAT